MKSIAKNFKKNCQTSSKFYEKPALNQPPDNSTLSSKNNPLSHHLHFRFFFFKNKYLETFSAKNISSYQNFPSFSSIFHLFAIIVRYIYDIIATALSLHAHELFISFVFSSFLLFRIQKMRKNEATKLEEEMKNSTLCVLLSMG